MYLFYTSKQKFKKLSTNLKWSRSEVTKIYLLFLSTILHIIQRVQTALASMLLSALYALSISRVIFIIFYFNGFFQAKWLLFALLECCKGTNFFFRVFFFSANKRKFESSIKISCSFIRCDFSPLTVKDYFFILQIK